MRALAHRPPRRDLLARLGVDRPGVERLPHALDRRVAEVVALPGEQPAGGVEQGVEGGALVLDRGAQLRRVGAAGEEVVLRGDQRVAGLPQRARRLRLRADDLVDRPGRDARLAQRLDAVRVPAPPVRPQALGERVALGDERVERQAVEGVGVVRRHGATRRSAASGPSSPSGWSTPSISRSVGATSARTPPSRSAAPSTVTITGTGLSECAVFGEPSGSSMWSALPWSAVMSSAPPRRLDRLDDLAEARVDRLDRLHRRRDDAGVADHVGVREVDDPEARLVLRPRRDERVARPPRALISGLWS